jgi:hypothetical protein
MDDESDGEGGCSPESVGEKEEKGLLRRGTCCGGSIIALVTFEVQGIEADGGPEGNADTDSILQNQVKVQCQQQGDRRLEEIGRQSDCFLTG